ncbi:MAG: ATP-binding cassette domain-containing protein [Nitrospirota bacterium]|nr:ATP-binding cassette domain-containing protein [Nitrospirota bacterium]
MICVKHLTKRYGNHTAIEDVSFVVKKGEILAFLGPNGAGKTTTMRILTGFMPPSEGTVTIAGLDSFEHPEETKRQIGYLPEHPPLYEELTVREYLKFVGLLKGLPPARVPGRISHVVEQLNIEPVQHRVIGHLSKGYRQRVGLAQALIHDPPILILDEPTSGLDPKQIIEIRHLIQTLGESHTIVLSTHILSEATAICGRVMIIHQGHIVAEDTPELLTLRFRQTQKLILTVKHVLEDWKDRLLSLPGILQVVQGSTANSWIIECELGQDHRDVLAQFVVNQGAGLLELSPVKFSLEEVFLQLTEQNVTRDSGAVFEHSPSEQENSRP